MTQSSDYDSLVPPPLAYAHRGFLVTAPCAGFVLADSTITTCKRR